MIAYPKLAEKFIDKGYLAELHYFISIPPRFILGKTEGTYEEQKMCYNRIVQKVYGEGWDYWNTWIDYQKHK